MVVIVKVPYSFKQFSEWNPSETVWLHAGVSSDIYIPEDPFPVTSNCKVVRIECVHGVPSQFPVPRIATAYILNFRAVRDSYQDKDGTVMPLDAILRDQDCQSWDRTPGERQKGRAPLVHQQLFASLKRLHQGSMIQDKAICFVATVKKMKCTGKDAAGAACDGYQVLKTATKVSVSF
ncbi:hypothetical protein B0H10DRAFT_2225645 [Mycena sp. CBHHK59/15]|nr:hypothetical protein B0H10DRAFT_2225645 [Mycena sp. CBHHK59/15]